jgi:hypothetical protein
VQYPRPGEPIVPKPLRPLVLDRRPGPRLADSELLALVDLGPRAWGRLPAATCQRLGLLVVDRVQTRIATLPEMVLRIPMPDPRTALALPLERRTLNTLQRELANGTLTGTGDGRPDGPWTIGRYLGIRRFGGRALVDLLAAVEARGGILPPNPQPEETPPVSAVSSEQVLHNLLVSVSRRLPLSEAAAQATIAREAGDIAEPDLTQLVRTAVQMGSDVPFRTLDLGGTRMLVRPSELTLAQTAYRLAARAVQGWGAVTVGAVTAQVHAAVQAAVDAGFVERLLTGIGTFRWLDREGGWFWLLHQSNPLLAGVRKVLSVVPRVSLIRLRAALLRARQGVALSLEAIREVCLAIPGARVTDGIVAAAKPDAVALTETERRLVKILRAAEPSGLPDTSLRAMIRAVGLPWTPILRLLRCSPLVECAANGRFVLVGTA